MQLEGGPASARAASSGRADPPGELPLERLRGGLVASLEGKQASLHLLEVGEVVGGEDFALDDGVVDLDLIEPGGVDGRVDEPKAPVPPPGVAALQPVDGCL